MLRDVMPETRLFLFNVHFRVMLGPFRAVAEPGRDLERDAWQGLFPLQVRGFALGVATLVNRATSGTIALTFLSLSAAITPAGAYCLFAALALVACAFTTRCVPETKGKSLEEIERHLSERYLAKAHLLSPHQQPPHEQPHGHELAPAAA